MADLIDQILAAIRATESGDYGNSHAGSSASGAYQFIDSTWRGAGGGAYAPRAYQATPAQQDLVARAYVSKIIAANPGKDPAFVVPRVWYVGSLSKPDDYLPPGNKLTVGQYAMKWVVNVAAAGGGSQAGIVDGAVAIVKGTGDKVADAVLAGLGDLAEPFLKGLRKIAIVGIVVGSGMALVVAGAWRGVKAGG
jgi:hypothetical protein